MPQYLEVLFRLGHPDAQGYSPPVPPMTFLGIWQRINAHWIGAV